MSRKTQSPAIPEGGEGAVQAIKEAVEIGLGRRGEPLETFVTFRDLKEGGFDVYGRGGSLLIGGYNPGGPGSGPGPVPGGPIDMGEDDLTKPPRPRNVRAIGISMSAIGVTWAEPGYNNHKLAEIFASRNNDWDQIASTFDVSLPVSSANRTPYLMGSAIGTTFLHRNLEATIPTVVTSFPVTRVTLAEDATWIYTDTGSFRAGDRVHLSNDAPWVNNGFAGVVQQVLEQFVVVSGLAPGDTAPEGSVIIRTPEVDELEEARNPDPVYYWVRFVSTANVVGDTQSQDGIRGTVFSNPETILNILIGRIRETHLANELLAPINYVRGPLVPRIERIESYADRVGQQLEFLDVEFQELAADGRATIGQIDDLRYVVDDQAGSFLQQVRGFELRFDDVERGIESQATTIEALRMETTDTYARLERFNTDLVSFQTNSTDAFAVAIDDLRIEASETQSSLERLRVDQVGFITDQTDSQATVKEELRLTASDINARLERTSSQQVAFTTALSESIGGIYNTLEITASELGARMERQQLEQVSWRSGIEYELGKFQQSVASTFNILQAEAGASLAYVNLLRGVEATFTRYDKDANALVDDGTGRGLYDVISRISTNELVRVDNDSAIAYLESKLSIQVDPDDPESIVYLNALGQKITELAGGGFNNSITMKVQRQQGGVIQAAGFGIGMQSVEGDNPITGQGDVLSSFIVSADQFAITGAGRDGLIVNNIRTWWTGSAVNKARMTLTCTVIGSTYDASINAFRNLYVSDFFTAGDASRDIPASRVVLTMSPPKDDTSTYFTLYNELRGQVFTVTSVGERSVVLRRELDEFGREPWFVNSADHTIVAGTSVAVFKETNVPFVVDTRPETPIVGIRGDLVVDGLIRAREAQIDKLAATKIFSGNITNFGLLQTKSVVGEAIATARIGGWAVKMQSPSSDAHDTRVLEFSRWLTNSDNLGNLAAPEDPGTWDFDLSTQFPQLNSSPSDTVFFIGTKGTGGQRMGTAYMRGSLLIDGQSRVVTGGQDLEGRFVQMDQEFPIMVMRLHDAMYNEFGQFNSWISPTQWDPWNYTDAAREYVRRKAFFWVDKDGQAGFNAPSGAIYLNDNPLELPASSGNIRVIRRLAGQTGRVFVSASFQVDSNRYVGGDRLGIQYGLVLVPTTSNIHFIYGSWTAYSPASRTFTDNGKQTTAAPGVSNNFVIARWNSDMGTGRDALLTQYVWAVDGVLVHSFFCNSTTPSGRAISGAVSLPAGSYKAVVVACELVNQQGTSIFGAVDSSFNDSPTSARGGIIITQGHIHSQQVADRTGL